MTILKVGLYKYKRVGWVVLLLFSIFNSFAQTNDPAVQPLDSIKTDANQTDSLSLDAPQNDIDSIISASGLYIIPDTAQVEADTLPPPVGDIETTINYSARDSLTLNIKQQLIDLYGTGKIVYGDVQLDAEHVNVNYSTNEIMAEGMPDSVGNMVGEPVFKDGPETYETKSMRYNFKSKKAIISGVVTQQGEGIMHGNRVKRDQMGNMYIDKAKYTTCNYPEPHFHIQANKLKLVPDKKILVGPFHMRVNDIPLPIGWGFGMFPMPRKQSSGVIVPTFGEEKRRGFYLRDGGYYFAISDYVDLALTGEIYSKGSYGIKTASTYRKRYAYNGQFSFSYNRQKGVDEADSSIIKDFWVNWSHSPQSKGTGRFSASVRAGTSTYNQNNPSYYDVTNNLNQEFSSNVNYNKSFTGTPFNLGLSARLQQNTNTGIANMQLPDFSLNMNRIYPFKGKSSTAKNIIQKINFSWNANGTNRISNDKLRKPGSFKIANDNPVNDSIVAFTPSNWEILSDRMQNGVRHTLPISTSAKVLKHFTLSPTANYEEIWYGRELSYTFVDSLNAVRIDTTQKFARLNSYSFGAGLNTRLYGTMYFKGGNVQAIRHVMTPSMSFSYAPDFSDEKFGYYQEVQVDTTGRTQFLSKYEGFVYGTPSRGEVASIGFSLANTLEMKMKSKKDTTDEYKKVPILENFSLSSGYNFLAEEFKLAPISMSARTKIFNKKLDINLRGTLDPYIYRLDTLYEDENGNRIVRQEKIDRFAWDSGQGLGQISSANLSLGTSLNPDSWENKAAEVDRETLSEEERNELEYIQQNPDLYVDFTIPWNVRINYNVNYSKRGFEKSNITQSLRLSGDFSLTAKWKFTYSTGYDFQKKAFTQTNISINRDLHCWQMSLNWVPFGRYQSYNVSIRAKSSLLQDLKLNRQRSWWDN